MTATREQIVQHFIDIEDLSGNWGTAYDNSKWNVDDTVYINGIMVTVDGDYYMGYVLEIVEKADPSIVSWVAVATFHGRGPNGQEYLAQWYPHEGGSFFDRLVNQDEVAAWGVRSVYGLWESRDDAKAASRRSHPSTKVPPLSERSDWPS